MPQTMPEFGFRGRGGGHGMQGEYVNGVGATQQCKTTQNNKNIHVSVTLTQNIMEQQQQMENLQK